MYDDILVPTDGSETARAAIEQAVDLADQYDATVHALYVVDVDAVNYSLGTEQVDRIKQGNLEEMTEVKADADTATGEVADVAEAHGVPVEEHVTAGDPADEIQAFADGSTDLVVMGSHGRTGISRVVLGSVTETVLRNTRRPVLVADTESETVSET